MAGLEAVYELMPEADQMVAALVEKYPEKFGHIADPSIIGCVGITGKAKPESQSWDGKICGVKQPEGLWSKKNYCIKFFKETWEKYNECQRAAMLFRLLTRVAEDCDGKILPEDLKECYCLVKAFGLNYMDSPGLPDLLKSKQIIGEGLVTKDEE